MCKTLSARSRRPRDFLTVASPGALALRADADGASDDATWNVGAASALTDRLTLDLRHQHTSEPGFGDLAGGRAAATLKASV